jgi:hypothetical protein
VRRPHPGHTPAHPPRSTPTTSSSATFDSPRCAPRLQHSIDDDHRSRSAKRELRAHIHVMQESAIDLHAWWCAPQA